MMITDRLEWTSWDDAQWEEWNRRCVSISLDFFDSLTTAVELLHKGASLTQEERRQWSTTVSSCQSIIQQHIDSINAMAGRAVPEPQGGE